MAATLVAVLGTVTVAPISGQQLEITLDQAVRRALQYQPTMVQARGNVANADWSKRQSWGNWLPSVNLSSGISSNSSERFDPTTQRTVSGSSTQYNAGLNAALLLFDGFARSARNRAATADYEAADASLINQQFQTALQTKQTYFAALASEALIGVSQRRIERALEQLSIAKQKLLAGSATRNDTLLSTVEVANARLQLVNAETSLAISEANLARLVGELDRVSTIMSDEFLEIVRLDTAALRAEAMDRSPAIEEATSSEQAADAQVTVSRGSYFPAIIASYSNSLSGAQLGNMNSSWSARLSFSWTIFNGFSRELNLSRSTVNRDVARAQAEDARRQVNAQLTQYFTALLAAETRLQIAQASEAAATEDVRVQTQRYQLGAATIVDLLASQISLDQAAVDIVQARFDYVVALAQIEAIVGREL